MVAPGTGDGQDDVDALRALAEQLEHAKFTVAFRGFEPREVHALLADAVRKLRALSDGAAAQLRAAEGEAERILEEARRQADELRREATELKEQARASVLEGIRDANLLRQRARDERGA